MWDPQKMAEGKAAARLSLRRYLRWVALLAILAAYWIGHETGQLRAASETCREWLAR